MIDEQVVAVFVEEATELVRRASTAAMKMETAEEDEREPLHASILRDLHTLKGSAGSSQLAIGMEISERVHHLEDQLQAAGGPTEAVALMGDVINELDILDELVQQVANGAFEEELPEAEELGAPVEGLDGFYLFDEEDDDASPAAPPPPRPKAQPKAKAKAHDKDKGSRALELLRVRPARIDATHEIASELMVSRLQNEALTSDIRSLRDAVARAALAFRSLHTGLKERRSELGGLWMELDPVLARMHADLSELRTSSMGIARRSTSLRDRSGALIGAIEESIRTLRVMPLQPFLEELLPVARQACKGRDVRVRLEVDGGGNEADRQVLVGLREPLLHLVRNAVAHGVGTTAQRQADGRSPTGTVRVVARCQGPRLLITVDDDGYGIDVEKVARRGAELGMVPADTIPDNRTLLSILSVPGVSTAQATDKLAGRGVGMNAVMDSIERLGGRLELEPNPGTGAAFYIDVPIAAAATKGLVVECGPARFGLPLGHIERVVRLRRGDIVGTAHPFAHIEGEPVAVAPLGSFVDQPSTSLGERRKPAVVVRAHGSRLALLVDDVPGESELVVKPMPRAFAQHGLVVGGAVQADSSVLLVLDLPTLVLQVQRHGAPALELETTPANQPTPRPLEPAEVA